MGYTTRIGTHSLSSLTNLGTEENLVAFMVYLTPYSDRNRTAQDIVDDIQQNITDFTLKRLRFRI